MQVQTIYDCDEFRVNSHGNGLAYELRELNEHNKRSVFVQGDDADEFRKELEWYVSTYGTLNGLRHLWSEYECVAS